MIDVQGDVYSVSVQPMFSSALTILVEIDFPSIPKLLRNIESFCQQTEHFSVPEHGTLWTLFYPFSLIFILQPTNSKAVVRGWSRVTLLLMRLVRFGRSFLHARMEFVDATRSTSLSLNPHCFSYSASLIPPPPRQLPLVHSIRASPFLTMSSMHASSLFDVKDKVVLVTGGSRGYEFIHYQTLR